jgi:coenzyme F420-0:L-glutamate ligase / coenzyme F420-1:gamma-L-glutamate ligase
MALILTPLPNFPLVKPGDNIAWLIGNSLKKCKLTIKAGDIFIIAQKVISKAENRLVNLNDINPGQKARELAKVCEKDPRLVELILNESNCVVRNVPGTIIVEHKLGFICANAGIDHSNVNGPCGDPKDWVLLLPENPDGSARSIREALQVVHKVPVGVLIIDSHGRAWRTGITGTSIGMAGIPAIVDMRGKPDLFNYSLRITQIAAADELAAGASLMMGQACEGKPVVHARGFPYPLQEDTSIKDLIRDKNRDLFR